MKTLFCLGNKWIAHLTQLLTRAIQNRCSESIRKISEKAVELGSFFNVQHTYF